MDDVIDNTLKYDRLLVLKYLEDNVDPTILRIYQETFQNFIILDYQGWSVRYNTIIDQSDFIDKHTIVDDLRTYLEEDIHNILQAHGIKVTSEITIFELSDLLTGIVNLNYLKDYTEIKKILSSEDNDIDKFSDIMGIVTQIPEDHIHTLIEYLSETFLDSLRTYIEDIKEEDTNTLFNKILDGLRQFKRSYPDSLIFSLTKKMVPIGLSIQTYLNEIDFKLRNVDQLTKDIYGILLASKEGYVSPLSTFNKYIKERLEDQLIQDRVYSGILKLNGEIHEA